MLTDHEDSPHSVMMVYNKDYFDVSSRTNDRRSKES